MKHIAILLLCLLAGPALAHIGAHPLTRIILVEPVPEGTRVTLQVPALLAYAPSAAAQASSDAPVEARFLESAADEFGLQYFVDGTALAQNPGAVITLLVPVVPLRAATQPRALSARAISLSQDQEMLVPAVVIELVLLYPANTTLALAPMDTPDILPPDWFLETLISDTRGDTEFFVHETGPLGEPILIRAP